MSGHKRTTLLTPFTNNTRGFTTKQILMAAFIILGTIAIVVILISTFTQPVTGSLPTYPQT